jgi:hypothetical protein
MRAAGFRPATPALAQMLEISTDHACDAVGQHTPVGLPSPQSLLLSSTIDATGRCSQDLPGRHQASNRHRARCGRVLSLPRLRALQVCRRRPTLGVAPIPHGRHPQTFTKADGKEPRRATLPRFRSTARYGLALVIPSAFALLRLIASRWTGRSAGFAPSRILSTYVAERLNRSRKSGEPTMKPLWW